MPEKKTATNPSRAGGSFLLFMRFFFGSYTKNAYLCTKYIGANVLILVVQNLTSKCVQDGTVASSRYSVSTITVSLRKGFVRASNKRCGNVLTLFYSLI